MTIIREVGKCAENQHDGGISQGKSALMLFAALPLSCLEHCCPFCPHSHQIFKLTPLPLCHPGHPSAPI